MEGLNFKKIQMAYSSKGRKSVLEPLVMVKILIYAFSQGIFSSRKVEQACNRDINFRWLLSGNKCPHYTTISRFKKKYLSEEILEDLFYQFIKILKEIEEIEYENLFVDGTKIEANANKYTYIWKKVILTNKEKMFIKIVELIDKINEKANKEFNVCQKNLVKDIERIIECLEKDIEYININGNKEKRREISIKSWIKKLKEYTERETEYLKKLELMVDRNSYSKTDKDATFMRMKDDLLGTGPLKAAYNVQIGVESEYIIAANTFQNRDDPTTLKAFLNKLEKNLQTKYSRIICDAGYESEENYKYLIDNNYKYFIKPQTYEQSKKGSYKLKIGKAENMKYDEKADNYICKNNKKLLKNGTSIRKTKTGYEAKITTYECEDCTNCTIAANCKKSSENKEIKISKKFLKMRQISYENITSEDGIILRLNRSIQVEGAFGVLKNNYNFRRFLNRGLNNTFKELILVCFGYNINKLHSKIQNNRNGKHLHKIKNTA
jgi:transposase